MTELYPGSNQDDLFGGPIITTSGSWYLRPRSEDDVFDDPTLAQDPSSDAHDVEAVENEEEELEEEYPESPDGEIGRHLPELWFEDIDQCIRLQKVRERKDMARYNAVVHKVAQRYLMKLFESRLRRHGRFRRSNSVSPSSPDDTPTARNLPMDVPDPILDSPVASSDGTIDAPGSELSQAGPVDTTPTVSWPTISRPTPPARSRTTRVKVVDLPEDDSPSKLDLDTPPAAVEVPSVVIEMDEHAELPRSLFAFHAQQKSSISKFFGAGVSEALSEDFLNGVPANMPEPWLLHRAKSYSRWAQPIAVWLSMALARQQIKVDINTIYKGIIDYGTAEQFCTYIIADLEDGGWIPGETLPDNFAYDGLKNEIRRICSHYEQLLEASRAWDAARELADPRMSLASGQKHDTSSGSLPVMPRRMSNRAPAARDVGVQDEFQGGQQDRIAYRQRPRLVKTPQTAPGRQRDDRSRSPTCTLTRRVSKQMILRS